MNEPAFPVVESHDAIVWYGLTKRELFAAMAMSALLIDPSVSSKMAPRLSVDYADALIAALEEKPASPEGSEP